MTENILSPTNNGAFEKMLGQEKNNDILIHFLNSMLHREGPQAIVEATLNTDPRYREAGILNAVCVAEDNSSFIVEMLVSNEGDSMKRTLYCGMLGYVNQETSGGFFSKLKPLICLEIVNFIIFPEKENYRSEHAIIDEATKKQSLKDLVYVFVEIPKFPKDRPEDLLTNEEKWCYFCKHSSNDQAMRPLLDNADPVMQKAYDALMLT